MTSMEVDTNTTADIDPNLPPSLDEQAPHSNPSASSSSSSVRVAVRVRPLLGREKVERCDECIQIIDKDAQVLIGKNRFFTYDYAFSKHAQQTDIWKCVEPLASAFLDGYNATIFAYGQTGSGKTYTMGTGSCINTSNEEYGIVPRVIDHFFQQMERKKQLMPKYRVEANIRFLEVYGEEIRDLLVIHPSPFGDHNADGIIENTWDNRPLHSSHRVLLREGECGEVQVINATEEPVSSPEDCFRLLENGTLSRTTASTLMNAHSSRSHAIFTITMVQYIPLPTQNSEENGETEFETRTSYFNFVDLAGSERQKRTQAEGKRLKEGIEINKGLLALGNVISALGDEKKRGRSHVPYRDSKLTRMLQDSLGGNSRTLMLTCVSPADVNFEESLNALKYANRARNIKNKPVLNRDEGSALTHELRRQIQALQEEVVRLRNPGMSDPEVRRLASLTIGSEFVSSKGDSRGDADYESFESLRSRAETAETEVARLSSDLKRFRVQMDHLKEEMIGAQSERDYLRLCVEEHGQTEDRSDTAKTEKISVITEQLRTINDLQEKLREFERQRDVALFKLNSIVPNDSTEPLCVPSYIESDLKEGNALIEQVEKELERDAAALRIMTVGDDIEDGDPNTEDIDMEPEVDEQALLLKTQEDVDQHRVFQRRQRHLGESVQDLSHDISLKEQLVRNIRQSQDNFERLKSFYERKMAQMADEVRVAQTNRDQLVEEIQALEVKISQEDDQSGCGNGRLAKLARDLKAKEGELESLRKKQNEMNRFMGQKKRNEMQLRVLNAEISNMKRQKVELIKKMQAERKRFEEEASLRRREISNLKRSQARDKQQIQRLGSQKEAQERVLKRKMEEIAAAKMKLKHQQQLQLQARKMNAGHVRSNPKAKPKKPERDVHWLSEEVKKRAEEQQKLEKLQQERKLVTNEMEALYAERDKIQKELDQSLPSQGNIRNVLISPLKKDANRLKEISPEEEQVLYDLEERIEGCQAQLEYNEDKISEMMHNSVDTDDNSSARLSPTHALPPIDNTQSLPEARTLLKMLFGMAVDLKKVEQRKDQDIAKLQVDMAELNHSLEQEQERMRQSRLTYNETIQRMIRYGTNEQDKMDTSTTATKTADNIEERTQIVLSVAEEKNALLARKCDDLELACRRMEKCGQELHEKVAEQQDKLSASHSRIEYLENRLALVRTDKPRHSKLEKDPPPHKVSAIGVKKLTDDNSDIEMLEAEGSNEDEIHNADVLDHESNTNEMQNEPKSIFSRLSNPSNFTGIHKTRVKDNVSKRETLQLRAERNRARRVRDRTQTRPTRTLIPVEPVSMLPKREINRKNTVMEVLANMKREKEGMEPMDSEPDRNISSNRGSDENDSYHSTEETTKMEDCTLGFAVSNMPPPVPQPALDVYSRLAGQYTASAQSKRQRATVRRQGNEKANNLSPSHALHSPESSQQDIQRSGESSDLENHSFMHVEEIYDPLLGGESLLSKVHENYRERIHNRQNSN